MIGSVRDLCRPLAKGSASRPGEPRLEGPAGRALETSRTRLVLTGALFLLSFALVGWRLIDLALLKNGHDLRRMAKAESDVPAIEIGRGDILDRNGELLATSVVTWSLYADPKMVIDPARTAQRLSKLFPDLDRADLLEKLKLDKRFVWLRRHLTPVEYQEVIAHGMAGLGARKDRRRVYPHGSLAAHLTGYADIDSHGLAGSERHFDGRLQRGESVALSVDLRIQHLVREELLGAVKKHRAIGAMGVVLDVRTGETLAMVSLPEYDPHDPSRTSEETRFNRVTLGTYEMGSTFKIMNTAMALDSGIATLGKRYDASRPLTHGKFTINDFHGLGRALTVSEIFMFSSNIGSARMALEAGTARQMAFMDRAGLLKPAPIELPELGAPLYPRDWKPINTITIAYGHGLSVTPLHLASAVASIVNEGRRVPATLVKRAPGDTPPATQVVSVKTSVEMRQLMRLVVEKGTGKRAEAPGYFVGGKTGTADKSAGKQGYRRNTRIASFVGAFPIHAPRYVVLVMIDEPKATAETGPEATGGVVAAPLVREIVQKAAPVLGVIPAESTSESPGTKPGLKPAQKPQPRTERAARD